jgi:hypothetical protein
MEIGIFIILKFPVLTEMGLLAFYLCIQLNSEISFIPFFCTKCNLKILTKSFKVKLFAEYILNYHCSGGHENDLKYE